jgi:hypothetical protein
MAKNGQHRYRLGERIIVDEVFAALVVGLDQIRDLPTYNLLLENGYHVRGVVPGYVKAWPAERAFPLFRRAETLISDKFV